MCNAVLPACTCSTIPSIKYKSDLDTFTDVFPPTSCLHTKAVFLGTRFHPHCGHVDYSADPQFTEVSVEPKRPVVVREVEGEPSGFESPPAPRYTAFVVISELR